MSKPMLFTPLKIRDATLKNRIVIAPMHQYSAKQGHVTDWHLVNAGRYAVGGSMLLFWLIYFFGFGRRQKGDGI